MSEAKNTDICITKCLVNSMSDDSTGNDTQTGYLNVVELPDAPGIVNAILNDDGGGNGSLCNDWFVIKDNMYEPPYAFQQAQPQSQSQTTHWTLMNQLHRHQRFMESTTCDVVEGAPQWIRTRLLAHLSQLEVDAGAAGGERTDLERSTCPISQRTHQGLQAEHAREQPSGQATDACY